MSDALGTPDVPKGDDNGKRDVLSGNGKAVRSKRDQFLAYCFNRGLTGDGAQEFLMSLRTPIRVSRKTVNNVYKKMSAVIEAEREHDFIKMQKEIKNRMVRALDTQLQQLYAVQEDLINDVNDSKATQNNKLTNMTGRYSARRETSLAIAAVLRIKWDIELTPTVDMEIEQQIMAHAKAVEKKLGIGVTGV